MHPPTSPTTLLICSFILPCLLVGHATSSVTGEDVVGNERGIAVSLLEHDQTLLSESKDTYRDREDAYRPINEYEANVEERGTFRTNFTIGLDGFNLLWLIASKLQRGDGSVGNDIHSASSEILKEINGSVEIKSSEEIYLDSTWPRQYLRYSRKPIPISVLFARAPKSSIVVPPMVVTHLSDMLDTDQTNENRHYSSERKTDAENEKRILSFDKDAIKVNRFIIGNAIGFEIEFRMEKYSGSGYIISGRSLTGQPRGFNNNSRKRMNASSDDRSWFGLYAHTRSTTYTLRLEYRNLAWRRKKQLQVRLSDDFRKGDWQRLSVNIDFTTNTINYWLNCSAPRTVQVRTNISQTSPFYNVYRLLQHQARQNLPVKVTFRSVIVTNGNQTDTPRQCQQEKNRGRKTPDCTGGKVYMPCGPSCERTCRGNLSVDGDDDELRSCAIACVAGCHCPAGLVTHKNTCILSTQCPCIIGAKTYGVGAEITMNNELCTCSHSQWKCFAIPRFIHKPRNLTIRAGRTSQLTCAVSGNPLPTITWTGPLNSSYYIVEKSGGRISILVLRNMTGKEAGLYSCSARTSSGSWQEVATSVVRVRSPPVITLPQTIPVTRGYPVLAVDCIVSGLPPPSIRWRRNGKNVVLDEHVSIYKTMPGVLRLKLQHVRRSDAGEWTCLAYNSVGFSRRAVLILVRLPPPNSMAFHRKPVDQYVKKGHTAIFNCQILDHQSSTINVTWIKDDKHLDTAAKRIVVKRYRLIVRQVRREDAGIYACIVTVRRGGRKLRAKAELMIKGQMLPWSEWSQCSVTCGKGIMFKRRTCTGVPPNKKTCHGKFTHVKRCNSQVCPGVCSAVGDPHYKTFDGRMFNFHGDCGYVLSHDASGNEFKILLYNGVCGPRLSCLNSVTVILSLPGCVAVVDIERDGSVTVNSVRATLPFVSPSSCLTIDKIGMYIILNAGADLELRWALPHRFYLIVGPKYFGRTQGFCGNYNGDPTDDNIVPSGQSVTSDLEFGQTWTVLEGTVNFSCSAFRPLVQPCDRDNDLRNTARASCNFLLNERIFGPCHKVIPPRPFIESCMFDICSTSIKRTSIYFCTALSAYADECLREKIVLDWRTEDICNVRCYSGKIYMECGPRCALYCPGVVNKSGKLCSSHGQCISGCHCPEGTVLHAGRCVSPNQCPCVDAGMTFENSTIHKRNCEKCVCTGGKWQCVFNKELCDYPASVIRGPATQVAPLGYPVSFCCEAVGIPVPNVEWYRNGVKISVELSRGIRKAGRIPFKIGQKEASEYIVPVYGHNKEDLHINNVTTAHAGVYTCKATNDLGTQISQRAILTVIDPWVATCNPNPIRRILHLPEGCSTVNDSEDQSNENAIDIGRCLGLSCFYKPARNSKRNALPSCGRTRNCCQPSVTTPVTVNCSHSMYTGTFLVTVVRKCACAICEERTTAVEGVLKTAITGLPIKHAKVIHRGRVVTYTSSTGSFRISFPALPEETRYVTLTFVDVIFKRFPATIKNLPVIIGDVTIHTVLINGRAFHASFNASFGLHHMFRTTSTNNGERLRLIIPPSSLILQRGEAPYVGQVQAVFSLVKNDYGINRRRMQTVPGNFVGIDRNGIRKLIIPTYVLSMSLYDHYGRSMELCPGKSAVFIVTSSKFKKRILPWVLDELTGLWRERETKIDIYPRYNKKGEKMLFLSTKIPRFNTAWALSDSEDTCYLRARVLDFHNNSLPGVRVTMTTSDGVPSSLKDITASSVRSSNSLYFKTFVEDLTRITDNSGICLPIGCQKFGLLYASKQGNDLTLLQPDTPPQDMGRVANHHLGTSTGRDERTYLNAEENQFNNKISSIVGIDPKPPTFSYFRREDDCMRMGTDRHTYVFRDDSLANYVGGNIAHSRDHKNKVIQTMMIADQEYNVAASSRRIRNIFCHLKVSIVLPQTVGRLRNIPSVPMVVEAVTFGGFNITADMKMIGWRRETFKALYGKLTADSSISRRRSRMESSSQRRLTEEICVEYLCSEENGIDSIVYITVRPATDNAADGRESSRPTCSFSGVENNQHQEYSNEWETRPISKGGYTLFRSLTHSNNPKSSRGYVGDRASHWPHSERLGAAFTGRTFIESKNKCDISRGGESVSVRFICT